MVTVDRMVFEHRYRQLMGYTVRSLKAEDPSEISFETGLWMQEEGYKRGIWKVARTEKLHLDTWDTASSFEIVKAVLDTMAFFTVEGDRQNLVSPSSYYYVSEAFHAKPDKTAHIFYEFYKNKNSSDGDSFQKITALLGKKIHDPMSVVAYLFFLKDKEKYVPVRKDGFMGRLPKFKLSISCVQNCTWENYQIILDIMKQLQALLQEHIEKVDLLDAQSFFWMMHHVNEKTEEYNPDDIDDCETKIVKGYADGRQTTQYFVKKYERDPRNRAAAIKIHGYQCMACGFDFEKVYGEELGRNFIEVHHTVPLSMRNEEVIVNPETDLICLCANCHRMIHRKKNAIVTLEELKHIIQQQRGLE